VAVTGPPAVVTEQLKETVPWPGDVSVPVKVEHVINPSLEVTVSDTLLVVRTTLSTSTGCSPGSST